MSMKLTLPNPWFVAITAAILGTLTGSGTALLRATTTPLRTGAFATRSANSSGPRPAAQIAETTYNFGRVNLEALAAMLLLSAMLETLHS